MSPTARRTVIIFSSIVVVLLIAIGVAVMIPSLFRAKMYIPKSGFVVPVEVTPASLIGTNGWIEPERIELSVRIAIQSIAEIDPAKTKPFETWRDPSTTRTNYQVSGGEYTTVLFPLPQRLLERIPNGGVAFEAGAGIQVLFSVRYWSDRWDAQPPPGVLYLAIEGWKIDPTNSKPQPIRERAFVQALADLLVEELNK
jgi:hypothetical protein